MMILPMLQFRALSIAGKFAMFFPDIPQIRAVWHPEVEYYDFIDKNAIT
jgi:hypothetical protein